MLCMRSKDLLHQRMSKVAAVVISIQHSVFRDILMSDCLS